MKISCSFLLITKNIMGKLLKKNQVTNVIFKIIFPKNVPFMR